LSSPRRTARRRSRSSRLSLSLSLCAPSLALSPREPSEHGAHALCRAGTEVEIVDALPLFHTHFVAASLLQAAFTQAAAHAKTLDCEVCGYYTANEREVDTELSSIAKAVAGKVASNCEHACVLLVNNKKLATLSSPTPCLITYSKKDDGWQQRNEEALTLADVDRTTAGLPAMCAERVYETIADFEEHLEDIGTKDWLNPGLIS
jgi:hypothetical protein